MTLTRGNELRTTTGLNTVRTRHSVTRRSEPQIAVGVGPILILVADRAEIDCFVHAWRQADDMADDTVLNTVYARQHDGRCLAVTPTAGSLGMAHDQRADRGDKPYPSGELRRLHLSLT